MKQSSPPGLTITVKAAAEGQLADVPFEIPVGTVYRVGREGAREREAQRFLELARRDPNQAKSELVAEALASSIAKWTGCRTRTSSTLRPSHNSFASSRP